MPGSEKRVGSGRFACRFAHAAVITVTLAAGLIASGGHPGLAQDADTASPGQEGRSSPAQDAIVVAKAGSAIDARRSVIEGIKSFEASKYADAVTSLSIALKGEGLTSKDTAKALYYRGRSYKQLKKFPEAIADLTSAMWLKDGLSEAERQKAEADRKASYAGVGVASPATVARAETAAPAAAAPAAVAPVKPVAAAPAPFRTETSPARDIAVPVKPVEVARATRKTSPAPVPAPSLPWQTSVGTSAPGPASTARTTAQSATVRSPAYAPDNGSEGLAGFPAGSLASPAAKTTPAATAPSAPSPSSNPFQQVGSFFSNMTNAITGGSSSSAANAKPAPDSTASTGTITAVSGWNSGTDVAVAAPAGSPASATRPAVPAETPVALAPARKTAALAPPPAAPSRSPAASPSRSPAASPAPAAASKSGKYRLQLAAVRSRNEAERLARDLASQHRSALGSYRPEIDETVYGNMGTFYRVQVGPFASASEPQSLCAKIKSSGFDCLITGK